MGASVFFCAMRNYINLQIMWFKKSGSTADVFVALSDFINYIYMFTIFCYHLDLLINSIFCLETSNWALFYSHGSDTAMLPDHQQLHFWVKDRTDGKNYISQIQVLKKLKVLRGQSTRDTWRRVGICPDRSVITVQQECNYTVLDW